MIETNFDHPLDLSWSQNQDPMNQKRAWISGTDGAEVPNTQTTTIPSPVLSNLFCSLEIYEQEIS